MAAATSGLQHFQWLFVSAFAVTLAASCGDADDGSDDDGDEGPSSVTCDGATKPMGAQCSATYQAVFDCCADPQIAAETATTLICGMQVDEAACEQGGSTAVSAQCDFLAMRPECAEGAGGDTSDTGTSSTDTSSDTTDDTYDGDSPIMPCEGECTSDEHMFAYCMTATVSCMCVAEDSMGATVFTWTLSDCAADGAWCTDIGGVPECSADNGACGCAL